MVDRFDGLRHDAVIGSNHDDRDIRDTGTSGSHGCERLMARGIQERDLFIIDLDLVSTDMLGDATEFTFDDS